MRNKILILISLAFILPACSGNDKDDPLIIPPNFNEMPDLNKKDNDKKTPDKDIDKLRDLLLKDE